MDDRDRRLTSLEQRVSSLEKSLQRRSDTGTDQQTVPITTANTSPPSQPPDTVSPEA